MSKITIARYRDGAGTLAARFVGLAVVDEPGLGVDKAQIAADDVDTATFDYYTADPSITTATWTVNGVQQPAVPLTNGAATLQVTTVNAGKIEVNCNGGPSVTIEAVAP